MGMFAGAYLYVSVFAPSYESGIQTSENISEDALVIEGEMYGACSQIDACGSFRLIDAREYNYVSRSNAALQKGKLPAALRSTILDVLDEQLLEKNEQPVSLSSCSAYVGGNDYSYRISKDGVTYDLDTCHTTLAYNEDLQELFLDVWFVMENPSTVQNESIEIISPVDIFWERFRESKPE